MWSIIVALLVGAFIGYFNLLPPSITPLTNKFTTAGIVFLLFLMGGQIGSDKEIIAGLGQMGVQAVLYALAAIIGSVFTVKILEVVLLSPPKKTERGGGR